MSQCTRANTFASNKEMKIDFYVTKHPPLLYNLEHIAKWWWVGIAIKREKPWPTGQDGSQTSLTSTWSEVKILRRRTFYSLFLDIKIYLSSSAAANITQLSFDFLSSASIQMESSFWITREIKYCEIREIERMYIAQAAAVTISCQCVFIAFSGSSNDHQL